MESETILLNKVASFIREKEMLNKDIPVLVGFSGGADSTALLDVLVTLGYKCIAAHCNFHLRGSESIRDHEFARMTAREYGIPFKEIEFMTTEYAQSKGISIEMACRELRYEWFEELLQETGAQAIAIAHHLDDSIETFFLNLLRGTGIAGLTGINSINGNVVRPFSKVYRKDIENYLSARSIDFITDSSNKEDIYQRNKIRLQLIPLLREITPSACEAIVKTMDNLHETEKIYAHTIHQLKNKIVVNDGDDVLISIENLQKTIAPKSVLFELLREYDVSGAMIDDIWNCLDGISGKQFFAGDYRIIKDREYLIISPRETADSFTHTVIPKGVEAIQKPVAMRFELLDYFPGFVIPKDSQTACFDADKIHYPLILRKWEQVDKFVPFGMRGMKKVSDYFSDHKFSLAEKERTWLLCSDDQVIWIVGERSDNRFRITSATKKVLLVSLQ
ncbi:MAG: tRNA lysidine(34) synthetase TilS [Bacteroidales bacterium]